MRSFFRFAFLFLLGGFAYCTLEMLWRGRTHYSMFCAGGTVFIILIYISAEMQKAPLWKKCLLGAAVITATELIFGLIFNVKYRMNVWDYSEMPLNLSGQICLPYSILWFILCYILFKRVIKEDFYKRFF